MIMLEYIVVLNIIFALGRTSNDTDYSGRIKSLNKVMFFA